MIELSRFWATFTSMNFRTQRSQSHLLNVCSPYSALREAGEQSHTKILAASFWGPVA